MNNQKKQKKLSKILWLLLLVCLIIVALKQWNYKDEDKDAQTVSVFFAKHDIEMGERIKEQELKIRQIPQAYAHRRMVPELMKEFLLKQTSLVSIKKGDPILWDYLDLEESRSFSDYLGISERAMSIRVDELSGIQGLIEATDRIDVMALVQSQNPHEEPKLKLIAQNITVLLVEHNPNHPYSPYVLVLKVNPSQAAILAYAQTQGRLIVTLRSPKDNFLIDLEPVDADNLDGLKDYAVQPALKPLIKPLSEEDNAFIEFSGPMEEQEE